MPVLEVGGKKKNCRPSRLSTATLCVNAARLPNPYKTIKRGLLAEELGAITSWLVEEKPALFRRLKAVTTSCLAQGKDVRIQCWGGRHRSQALAHAVLADMQEDEKEGVCLSVLEARLQ